MMSPRQMMWSIWCCAHQFTTTFRASKFACRSEMTASFSGRAATRGGLYQSAHPATTMRRPPPRRGLVSSAGMRPPFEGPTPDLGPRYRGARLLARGGMGVVWEAHDQERGRPCAVKVL